MTNAADVAIGTAYIYQGSGTRIYFATAIDLTISYYSISLSLIAVLPTLMIVVHLIVHARNVRKVMDPVDCTRPPPQFFRWLSSLVCALYTVTVLLYIASWADNSWVAALFNGACAAIPVRVCLCLSRCATGICLTASRLSYHI